MKQSNLKKYGVKPYTLSFIEKGNDSARLPLYETPL
jgi:hypothetical protein